MPDWQGRIDNVPCHGRFSFALLQPCAMQFFLLLSAILTALSGVGASARGAQAPQLEASAPAGRAAAVVASEATVAVLHRAMPTTRVAALLPITQVAATLPRRSAPLVSIAM